MSSLSHQSTGLLALSDELIVLVLSFLQSGGDLLNCSRVSQRLRKLASDKSLVKRLSFRRDVKLSRQNFKFFFSIPSTCAKVVSLNLNGVHWIPAHAIHVQLVKMRNLQDLHVGDILFSAGQFSSLLSRLSQLVNLSLTWHWVNATDVKKITKPELAGVYSKLKRLNIFLATGDRCPLDKVTWLLALCRDLTYLAILSQTLHAKVRSLWNRYNIVVHMREFNLPALTTVVWDVRNETFPCLLVTEVKQRLATFLSPGSLETPGPEQLMHLEIRTTANDQCVDALASASPLLETLIVSGGKYSSIAPSLRKSFSELFQSFESLSHLELSEINNPALLIDLKRTLKFAKRLKTLKIKQRQVTQYTAALLDSLSVHCDIIENVVLVDTSRAFTQKKFPLENVIRLVEKISMKFIYLCSELLTLEDVKSFKRQLKNLLVVKPHLVARLQSTWSSDPFYGVGDICDLPMELQTSVASLSAVEASSVARVSLSDIF